jgi:uncharacterized protein YdaU (DUF1376 family)
MSKDPAILFYTGDFLNGCTDLTFEERGQYITLLCLQHQKGHLSEKTIRLCVGSVSVDVLKKFQQDENGNYFQNRMEEEIQKRAHFIDTRYFNGKKGGRPVKANNKPNRKPNSKAKQNLPEDENINENINRIDNEWLRWKKFKKDEFNFRYKSEVSEDAAKNELINLAGNDEETAIKIIEQSIANGWKGFFKLKANGTNRKTGGATTDEIIRAVSKHFPIEGVQ